LQRFKPERVLDIGANTGTYSLIAAESGSQVIALDSDSAAIETLWIEMAKGGSHQAESVTTLVANIARPTPAVGWRNREQLSLLERLTGNSDMVFLLAVIHHLILREQMPLPHIADLCASLTSRLVLLEWVPASDPMFQEWLRGRENLYGHLSESDLHHAFGVYFTMIDRCVLPNDRVLLLFELNLADHAPTGAHSA
jgi:SAM-dependent methyltransferase